MRYPKAEFVEFLFEKNNCTIPLRKKFFLSASTLIFYWAVKALLFCLSNSAGSAPREELI